MIAAENLPALVEQMRLWARELGFADADVAHLDLGEDCDHLQAWLDRGDQAGMAYMSRHLEQRADPRRLRPGTLSVISLRMDYRVEDIETSRAQLANGEGPYIARYALGRDYHRSLRSRLVKLGQRLESAVGEHGYRVFTDSAPVFEKALARNARLGWIGKNTLLLNRQGGSLFFLGEIYTDLLLPPSQRETQADLCGSCSACLKICPTQAFSAPYRLDARRCISYLTIEHHGSIPEELRPLIGNRIFGCDDCQLVCPWNRYARLTSEADFAPRHGLDSARLVDLFAWTPSQWLARTEGMALRRAGYAGWLRNIAVALGNAPRSPQTLEALQARAHHDDEIVREHVAWALLRQEQTPACA